MNNTAIFYSFNSNKTAKIGTKIAELFGKEKIDIINVETTTAAEFNKYELMILGVPTWFDGELPNYWDELLPALEDLDFKGKKVAIFGLGDQKNYPENFCDAIGIMANFLEQRGAEVVGKTSIEGYKFESSAAIKEGQFLGLVLDQENQARLTDERIKNWIESIKA
jgi:flavodoxin I